MVECKERKAVRGWIVCVAALSSLCCHRAATQQLPVLPVGGDFTLTDHNNQRFELSSLRGKAVVMMFGYTSCPDACPTTLSKLASVYRRLGDDAKRVKTLYVSVDSERDTPDVLKADLGSFAVDALGLTGTKAEIDTVVALYGAEYKIIPTPNSAEKYTVGHTVTLYALDAAGRVRLEFPYDASAEEIVKGLRAILGAAST
jgi:protein SCO1/2